MAADPAVGSSVMWHVYIDGNLGVLGPEPGDRERDSVKTTGKLCQSVPVSQETEAGGQEQGRDRPE